MKRPAIILFVLCFYGQQTILNAQEAEITPESFEWMSKTSIDIMTTYNYYNSMIEEYDPRFLINARGGGPFTQEYFISTPKGTIYVNPMQIDMVLYWKWQISKAFSLPILMIAGGLELMIDPRHSDETDPDNYHGRDEQRRNRKLIMAVRPTYGENIQMTIGGLAHQTPVVEKSDDNKLLFSDFDKESGEYRTYAENVDLFFQADIYGYEISSLYEFQENSFYLIQLEHFFNINERIGKVAVGFNYYKYLKTYQAGFQLINHSILSGNPLSLEFFWDIYRNKTRNEIGYIAITGEHLFKRDLNIPEEEDFYMRLKIGASYSKDIFPEGLPGMSAELFFENIWGYLKSISAGYSINYHHHLHRVPIKNNVFAIVSYQIRIPQKKENDKK